MHRLSTVLYPETMLASMLCDQVTVHSFAECICLTTDKWTRKSWPAICVQARGND